MVNRIREDMKKYKGLKYIVAQLEDIEKELSGLDHYGMVLLGPDSFQQNETKSIIDFFENNNFKIVDIKIKKISRTESEMLFLPTSTCMNCGDLKWWMIQDATEAGPFAAVLLYCDDLADSTNCLEKLNLYKGKSNPLSNNTGVIRYDFKAINVCLNLLHIPDNYADFFKDTSPFYTVKDIVNILRKKDNLKEVEINEMKFNITLHERRMKEYVFEETIYKLKYLIAVSIPIKAIVRQLLPTYHSNYEILRQMDKRELKNNLFMNSLETEKAQLDKLVTYCIGRIKQNENSCSTCELYVESYDKLRLLSLLTKPNEYKRYQHNFFDRVHGYGVVFSKYEELIINTSLMQWRIDG